MIPFDFPQANVALGAPRDLDETHIATIPAFMAKIEGQSVFDGSIMTVVAWKPSPDDLVTLLNGGAVYVRMIGGCPPHYLSTTFEEAIA